MEILDTPDKRARDEEKMLTMLAQVREPFETTIDDLISFVNYNRRKIKDKENPKGKKAGIDVYDGTAVSAKNLLVDGMCGYMCSRALRWYRYGMSHKFNFPRFSGMRAWSGKRMDEYPEVKRYLQDGEDVSYSAFDRSNFYDAITEFVSDGVVPGTAHLIWEEDVDNARIVYTVPHFRECYIAEDQYGRVDTNYRVYKLTLRQLAEKFGIETMENADLSFRIQHERNPYEEREVLHAIYPRKIRQYGRIDGKNKPIASVWVLRNPLKLLDESGYDWQNFVTWRWRKNSDELYGRSPAWDAYVEIMLANQQGKTNLIAGHKMAEPPMVGHSDLRGKIQAGPAGWTWVDNIERQMPKPLLTGINQTLPFAIEYQERVDRAIKEHFHVNFFLMLYQAAFNKVDLTATQVIGMQGEQAAVLGTRVGRLESEAFDQIIDGQFYIEDRAGRMPQVPAILEEYSNGKIEIEYLGPLAQAQKRLTKTRQIQAGVQLISEIANIHPGAIDVPDWDAVVIEALDASGFPASCIRDDEEIGRIRQMRAEQQQMAQQAEMIPKVAKGLTAAGKEISPDSMLGSMMGKEGGAAV